MTALPDWRVRSGDPMTRTYALVGLDKGKLVINDPVELVLDLETLR